MTNRSRTTRTTQPAWGLVGLAVLMSSASAVAVPKIGDITHLQGTRTNKLTGMGLVVGLPGTGDGGKYLPTMRALAQLHKNFGSPIFSLEELKDAGNVAIVQVEATLGRNGVRQGESIDAVVSSLGPAQSLAGGRLLMTPLVGPHPDDPRGVMALASGLIYVENEEVPTVGRISNGATLEQDWIHNYIVAGRDLPPSIRANPQIRPDEPYVTLVLDENHDEWGIAYTIARTINSAMEVDAGDVEAQFAMAIDARTVVVRIPPMDRANPASFLYQLEKYQLIMPLTEARVTIHRASGTIVISGDVEVSPAVVSHKGLTITTMVPRPEPSDERPRLVEQRFVPVDPQNKGGAKLRDLVEALNQLRVPAQDRITIVEKLYETGRIHAKFSYGD